jgi:predicted CopG family antitoxin
VAKTVKVHEDTHRALKHLKSTRRSKSMDEVIRELIRSSTGTPVGGKEREEDTKLSSFLKG